MSRHIRFLALALAVLMLVPAALAGCSNNEEPTNSTVTTPSTNDATGPSSEPSGGAISAVTDDPDKIDLGGYEFVLSTTGYACLRSVFAEGETLSVEAEDLQEHYKEIEDTLNCVIIAQNMTSRCDCMDELLPSAIGGIKFADFICCRQSTWIPLAMMGGLRPLDSMIEAGLDLYNEENFYQTHTQMSEINGHIYACDLAGKYRTVRDDVSLGYFYAFNKELCENAGYPAEVLYQAVRDGEWTYEMMLEIARKISKDTDGDGAPDIWGLSLTGAGDEIWSNGAAPITYDKAQGK